MANFSVNASVPGSNIRLPNGSWWNPTTFSRENGPVSSIFNPLAHLQQQQETEEDAEYREATRTALTALDTALQTNSTSSANVTKPTPPKVDTPELKQADTLVMPYVESNRIKHAQRRRIATAKQRGGRASTMMSGGNKDTNQ